MLMKQGKYSMVPPISGDILPETLPMLTVQCRRLFKAGITILDLATMIGCFKHERDAMRIIGAGGFYINTIRITNIEEVVIHGKHIMANNMTVVRVGKKNHYIVEWT